MLKNWNWKIKKQWKTIESLRSTCLSHSSFVWVEWNTSRIEFFFGINNTRAHTLYRLFGNGRIEIKRWDLLPCWILTKVKRKQRKGEITWAEKSWRGGRRSYNINAQEAIETGSQASHTVRLLTFLSFLIVLVILEPRVFTRKLLLSSLWTMVGWSSFKTQIYWLSHC